MIPNIIMETRKFLNVYKLSGKIIEKVEVEFEDNQPIERGYLSSGFGSTLSKDIPLTIQIMTVFSMLDAYIDLTYPELNGLNFQEKYKKLNKKTDNEIIFSQLYRIFRTLRNTIIHDCSKVNIKENKVDFNGINIGIDTLKWLYSFVCEFFSNNKEMYHSKEYHDGVMRYYYKKIVEDLLKIKYRDNIEKDFPNLSSNLIISVTVRYFVKDPKYNIINKEIKISRYKYRNKFAYKSDYFIFINGKEYCIPDEALNENGNISSDKIDKWELGEL